MISQNKRQVESQQLISNRHTHVHSMGQIGRQVGRQAVGRIGGKKKGQSSMKYNLISFIVYQNDVVVYSYSTKKEKHNEQLDSLQNFKKVYTKTQGIFLKLMNNIRKLLQPSIIYNITSLLIQVDTISNKMMIRCNLMYDFIEIVSSMLFQKMCGP